MCTHLGIYVFSRAVEYIYFGYIHSLKSHSLGKAVYYTIRYPFYFSPPFSDSAMRASATLNAILAILRYGLTAAPPEQQQLI